MILMSNTDKLIHELELCNNVGINTLLFNVGKYTGNNPSVVNALRRRGYKVSRVPGGAYELSRS